MALTDVLQSLRLSRSDPGKTAWDLLDAWRGRLGACLPRALRPLLLGRDRRLLVLPEDGEAQLYLAEDDARSPVGELALDAGGPLPQLPGAKGVQVQRTVLLLAPGQVLRRSLSFPVQVRENLQQVIRYEVDRLSPFQADQIFFDTRLDGTSRRGDRILVELALCRRDCADPWLQRLREAGSPAEQVTWEGAWPKANLLPVAERPRRATGGLRLTLALSMLALLLGAAALVTPLWQRGQVLEALQAELARVRTAAQEVDTLRTELERARQGSVAVLQRKTDQPRMIDLLRELTARLPDGTWIQNLNLEKGEVQLRGESTQATALLALLEKAAGVHGVSFASPVTQVAQTGAERFNITFQYQRPKPQ
jgi:general secretion pathway protein L